MNHCDAATVEYRILRADIETLRTKVKMAEETVKRVTRVNPSRWTRTNMDIPLKRAIPSTADAGLGPYQRVDKPDFLPEQLNRESIQNQIDTNPNIFETLPHWRHKH